MKHNTSLTQKRLKEVLDYNQETGVFVWKKRTSRRVSIGKETGTKLSYYGYRIIGIDGIRYPAHRLAFFYVNGRWPSEDIDHINGVKSDNRIDNLREARHQQNMMNQKLRCDNSSGKKGCSFIRAEGKYRASVVHNNVFHSLGYFVNLSDAAAAYETAATRLFGAFKRQPEYLHT